MPGDRNLHLSVEPKKESDVLKEIRAGLDLLQSVGVLVYIRIHLGGRIFKGRKVKNGGMEGIPDLMILSGGVVGFLETKRPKGGRIEASQEIFRSRILPHGAKWGTARSLTEALDFLEKEMGIPCRNYLKT